MECSLLEPVGPSDKSWATKHGDCKVFPEKAKQQLAENYPLFLHLPIYVKGNASNSVYGFHIISHKFAL